jgi:hypothetical protein
MLNQSHLNPLSLTSPPNLLSQASPEEPGKSVTVEPGRVTVETDSLWSPSRVDRAWGELQGGAWAIMLFVLIIYFANRGVVRGYFKAQTELLDTIRSQVNRNTENIADMARSNDRYDEMHQQMIAESRENHKTIISLLETLKSLVTK